MKTASAVAASEAAALLIPAGTYFYRFWLACCFLAVFIYSCFADISPVGLFVLFMLNLFFCGDLLFRNCWQDVWHGKITVSVLVAVSALSVLGYAISKTFFLHPLAAPVESLYIPFSLLLVGYLWNASQYARSKARTDAFIQKLEDFLPKSARLVRDGRDQMIFAQEVKAEDLIKVKPGERVPCEGILEEGDSYIDESLITGNMLPARKTPGAVVYAGTLNKSAVIGVRVKEPLSQSILAGMIHTLKQSELRRRIRCNILDKYAWWVLVLMVIAAVGAYFCSYWQSGSTRPLHALGMVLFVLAIACPISFFGCALWPFYFLRRGAKRLHIFIQTPGALQGLPQAQAVFMDKTGTLTEGKLAVFSTEPAAKQTPQALWDALVTAEQTVEDPFARAITQYAQQQGIVPHGIADLQVGAGKGVQVKAARSVILAGRAEWLTEKGIEIPTSLPAVSQPVVYVAKNKKYLGRVLFKDGVRPGAVELVQGLQNQHKEVILMSGDGENSTYEVARQVGIRAVNFGVLPQTKAEIIGNYTALHKKCVMIGDGFNDVVALLRADVGILFSTGKNVYNNWVDVLIESQDLSNILTLFRMEKLLSRFVRTNVILSVLCNLFLVAGSLFAPLTSGQMTAVLFIGLSAGVGLVFFNSMRLLHIK